MAGLIYTTAEIRVDRELDPIILGSPLPLVLLSQGETRPGIKQGQHWGRPRWTILPPVPARRPDLRLSNPVAR